MSSHPLGGPTRPGRVIGPSLDKIIKNASWRKHTSLIASCKSSLDLLQSLPDLSNDNNNVIITDTTSTTTDNNTTSTPSTRSTLVGISSSHANSILSSLLLALDPSHPPKVLDPALDCLLRLISLRLLVGDVDAPNGVPILSSLLAAACGLTSSTAADDSVELSVLKLFVAAARSDAFVIRGEALVQILKACYNVYLGSHVALNQVIAKLVLAQILAIVYSRVEADSMEVKVKTVSVVDLLDLSDKSLNDSSLVQSAQGFIDEAMAWSGDGGVWKGEAVGPRNRAERGEGENEGLSRIREDGIYLFKNLCKFSMKVQAQESPDDPLLLRGKLLSLELLKTVMENAGTIWRTNDK